MRKRMQKSGVREVSGNVIPLPPPNKQEEPLVPKMGYACADCDEVFETPQALGSHRRWAHKGDK